jgi:Na+/H+ antiporter NhaC
VVVRLGSPREQSPLEDRNKLLLRILFFSILFAAICILAAWSQKAGGAAAAAPWYSIVPPLLAIMLAFLTRRVIPSLGIAVIVGGLLTSVPAAPLKMIAWWGGIKTLGGYLGQAVGNATNLQILGFFPPIFIMVAVIGVTGGFQGIIRKVLRWVRSGKSAQAATALMGLVYFIDDYSNSMIVGAAMRPVTDRHGISREKLAFLVDATSAPIAGLAVISTWIAYEVSLFAETGAQLGIAKDGYAMFFDALGYRFYCFLMIAFVFLHIFSGRDFGPMRAAQQEAKDRHVPASDKTEAVDHLLGGKARNAVIPLAGLVLSHLTGLWLDGGGWAKLAAGGSLLQWQYWREVIGNAEHSTLVLDYAALIGMTLALLCGFCTRTLTRRHTAACLWEGTKRSLLPIVILTLAWSLKNSCISLQTDTFMTTLLAGKISAVWFPPLLFFVASVTSFATGTSWGTMAILIPTAIPLAYALDGDSYGLITMISLGAVLDGAIFGDHCSPISDTTIISSMASSCDHMQHVRTQLPYSLFVAAVALVCGYLPSAFGLNRLACLAVAVLAMALLLTLLRRKPTSEEAEET